MSDEDAEDTDEQPTEEDAESAEDEDTTETEEESENGGAESDELTEESLSDRLNAAEEELDAAETEDDLDAVENTLDGIESDIEAADLPEPDEDEDEESPQERLEDSLSELRDDLESQRGPYAEAVVEGIEDAAETVETTEWTDQGEEELIEPVESFIGEVNDRLDADVTMAGESPDELAATLESAAETVESADLDPDEDEETIATLFEAVDDLQAGIDSAQGWDDLTVREKLAAQGFYEVLDHRKDFPPEWHALKVHEREGNVDQILLALDKFDSEFMERHALESLMRMGPEAALEPITQRAQKRDNQAIEILGKIGSDEPVDMLLEYAETEGDPRLQLVTLKALGEIGSPEATQTVADRLAAENDEVRSNAARALGLLGDTRAISPLADTLENDDDDTVRASAAWALNQIGTQEALDAVEPYADDRAYLVQAEAEKAV